jgi:monothiol glutaredoxin
VEQPSLDPALQNRIEGLLSGSKVVLFMKGTKPFPQCGFSAKVVGMLREAGVDFDAHNILLDVELREGLKRYSNWPTYPQLYVNGKLVGGCDIVTDLFESGQLTDVLAAATTPA